MIRRTVKFQIGRSLLINREKTNKFPIKRELKREILNLCIGITSSFMEKEGTVFSILGFDVKVKQTTLNV